MIYLLAFLIRVQSLTYAVYDTQLANNTCFSNEWTFTEAVSFPASLCMSVTCTQFGTVFGEIDKYSVFRKAYSNLDPHTQIQISISFYKFGAYTQPGETVTIQIDGLDYGVTFGLGNPVTVTPDQNVIISRVIQAADTDTSCQNSPRISSSVAGNPNVQADIVVTVPHTSNTANVQLYCQALSHVGKWGMNNYVFNLQVNCPIACSRCQQQTVCTVCAANRISLPTCSCPNGTYDSGIPQCANCMTTCATCSSGTSCLTCPVNRTGPQCVCVDKMYDNSGTCQNCKPNCATCSNSSSCLSCPINRSGSLCNCNDGFYELNGVCQACSYKCATCDATGCLTCSDPSRGIIPNCNCSRYEITNQARCPTCSSLCATCDQNGCLTCIGSGRQDKNCQCLPQYFENGNNCTQCLSSCSSCSTAASCLTCSDSVHLLPLCTCPTGFTDVRKTCYSTASIISPTATFSPDLTQILVSFNSATNVVLTSGATANSLSNCAITNIASSMTGCQVISNVFIMNLATNHTIRIGSTLIIQNGAFTINNQTSLVFNTVTITALYAQPEFTLAYDSQVLSCRQTAIQFSSIFGIGNKDYTTIVTPTVQINTPFNLNQTTTFSVTVINFLSLSTTKSITITVLDTSVPQLTLEPSLGTLYSYQTITFNLLTSMQTCSSQYFEEMTISWGLDNVTKNITGQGLISVSYEPKTFAANSTHNLNITYGNLSVTQTFYITPTPLMASIVGGSRIVSLERDLTLQAVVVDIDKIGYNFTWQCTLINNNDCGLRFNNSLVQVFSSQLLIPHSYFIVFSARNINVSVIILVADIANEQLSMNYPARYNTQPVNGNEQLTFQAQVIQNNLPMTLGQNSVLGISLISNQSVIYSTTQSSSIVTIKLGDYNLPSNTVTIKFQYDVLVAFVTLTINQPPQPGILTCTQSGIAMQTLFQMKFSNFTDSNGPLQYRLIAQYGKTQILLSDWNTKPYLEHRLAQGDYDLNSTVTIIGSVSDSLGAEARNVTCSIKSSPASRRLLQLSSMVSMLQNETDLVLAMQQYQQMQTGGCSKQCSNNGVCTNLVCVCNSGYYLDDCSANATQVALITPLLQNILTNLQANSSQYTQAQLNQITQTVQQTLNRPEMQASITSDDVTSNANNALKQLNSLFGDYSITTPNASNLISDPPNPQQTRRAGQVNDIVSSQTNVIDSLFSVTSYNSSSKYSNSNVSQDALNKQLLNSTKSIGSFKSAQLLTDQAASVIQTTNIQIISQTLSQGQSIKYFPKSAYLVNHLSDDELAELNEMGVGTDASLSVVTLNANPYNADSSFPYPSQSNQVVSPSLTSANGSVTPRRKLSYQIKVTPGNNKCIQQVNGNWQSSGCSAIGSILGDNSPQCSCSSIADVTIVDDIEGMFTNSNLDALANPDALLNFRFWESGLFYISVIMSGVWAVCVTIGWRRDKKDLLTYQPTPIESEKKIEIGGDEEEEELELKKIKQLQQNRKLAKDFIYGFPMLHQFISIFTVFSDQQPRPARFTIYFLKLVIMMALTSIFGNKLSIPQNVLLSIMAVALMAPLTAGLLKGFAHDSSKSCKIISYVFILIFFLGCWYVCLTVAAKLGVSASNRWLLTYCLSLLSNILIMETVTILLKLALIPYLKTKIHSGNFIIRILYIYLFDQNVEAILSKIN